MLAKLVIALACHAGDRGFEPRTSRFCLFFRAGFFFRVIAQLVARHVRDVEVPGSNPGYPTFLFLGLAFRDFFLPFRLKKTKTPATLCDWGKGEEDAETMETGVHSISIKNCFIRRNLIVLLSQSSSQMNVTQLGYVKKSFYLRYNGMLFFFVPYLPSL